VVNSLGGELVVEVSPPPATIMDLKVLICEQRGCPLKLQQLITTDHRICSDDEALWLHTQLVEAGRLDLTFVIDESPLFTWDLSGNPNGDLLDGQAGLVVYKSDKYDYVNVITEEPVRTGVHFFEFVMHQLRDEQWCGVTAHRDRAGYHGSLDGWFYYCGRRSSSKGALHAGRERRSAEGKSFSHVKDGDTIGMLVDVDQGGLAFSLNGVVQGACRVPQVPLYVTTCLDEEEDQVELRKPPLAMVPEGAVEVLAAAVAEEEPVEFDRTGRR